MALKRSLANHNSSGELMTREPATDYQRGYGKGYSTGRASADRLLAEYRAAVREANDRAIRAEAGIVGPCKDCARWKRNPGCAWGQCSTNGAISIADASRWGQPEQDVYTQETFGCVRFLTLSPAPSEARS